MSSGITQVKKRFVEMSTYLHKDDKGQQLLKLLKDDVNVLRKSLAAADAAKDVAVALMETARQRTDKAETAAASLVESNKRLQDQNNSLQSQVALLSKKLEAAEEVEDSSDVAVNSKEYAGAARVMKRLWKTLPKCPKAQALTPQQLTGISARGCVFWRHDIAEGWTPQDMWLLGATVATICGMFGQCVVLADGKDMNSLSPNSRYGMPDKAVQLPLYRHFMHWFSQNIDAKTDDVLASKALAKAAGYHVAARQPEYRSPEATVAGLGLEENVDNEIDDEGEA